MPRFVEYFCSWLYATPILYQHFLVREATVCIASVRVDIANLKVNRITKSELLALLGDLVDNTSLESFPSLMPFLYTPVIK